MYRVAKTSSLLWPKTKPRFSSLWALVWLSWRSVLQVVYTSTAKIVVAEPIQYSTLALVVGYSQALTFYYCHVSVIHSSTHFLCTQIYSLLCLFDTHKQAVYSKTYRLMCPPSVHSSTHWWALLCYCMQIIGVILAICLCGSIGKEQTNESA